MDDNSINFNLRHPKPLLIVISGLSGVGKDSVVEKLRERKLPFHFIVTATDRPPREGERDGIDYHFITTQQFEEMIERGEFIEYANVYSQHKGVPRAHFVQALEAGEDMVARVDVQGAARFRSLFPQAVLVFLTATSAEEWKERLISRGADKPEDLKIRMEKAKTELAQLPIFDYVVENAQGKLDETVDAIIAIIQTEHNRVNHREIHL